MIWILKRREKAVAAALASALLGVPGVAMAQSQEPIKIGFSSELSGQYSFWGTSCTAGMKLAEKRINAAGGVLHRPLQFLVVDNQTNPVQAAASARSFDVQEKVLAISGPVSSDNALAIYGYAEQNKVPFVAPSAAFPQLTKPGTHYTFRVEPDSVGWGYAIANFLGARKPGAKLAMMYSDYSFTRSMVAGIKYQAPRANIEVVADIAFPQGSNDATVQVAQVVAQHPDFVLESGVGAIDVTITKQLLELGLRPDQIIHHLSITSTILAYGKPSIGSLYGTFFDANLDNLTPEGHEFVKEFTNQNGRMPSYVENFCYITPYIIKAAIEKAGVVDREKFRDALSSLKMTEPTDGIPIEFDKNGARKEYMYFMQLEGVTEKAYTAKKLYFVEWDPEVLPVYELAK
jgi:branched-chain amino acid transport system substrate-binding protein